MSDGTPYTTETLENPMQPICGAKTRKGTPCQNPPVTGKRRCRMHGGTNPGAPVKTGLYSKVLKRSLRVKYQEFLADTGYTSLVSELALLRALTAEYAGRFVEGVALPGEDIERLASIIDKAGRLLERMNRIDAMTALTARELDLLSVVIIRELTADLGPDGAQAFWSRVTSSMFGFAELPAPQDVIEGASHVYKPV